MGWIFAVFFLFVLLINNYIQKEDIKLLKIQLNKTKEEYENFKNLDPEYKRNKLNFDRQLNNIKSININIKELVDALNYAKKKQTRINLVTNYNNHTIQIAGKGFDTTIQGN